MLSRVIFYLKSVNFLFLFSIYYRITMMWLFAQERIIYNCVLKKCSISKSVWKCCVPVYIEMPRKITASHISFIAVSITSKGFALNGCICTHTFKNTPLWGVILFLLYWCTVTYRRLGSFSKGFINY